MSFLVVNCNHWIGFHIVNDLLEEGYEVDGIYGEEGNDDLSMFFGRNSSFTLVKADARRNYDTTIIINETESDVNFQTKRTVKIGGIPEGNETKFYIKTPLLYGEWMTMNEKGMYRDNEFIPFNSKFFQERAIYIKDFTNGLIQWLKSSKLPSFVNVESSKNRDTKDVKLENSIYLRDNRPTDEKLKSVLDHYEKFKKIY